MAFGMGLSKEQEQLLQQVFELSKEQGQLLQNVFQKFSGLEGSLTGLMTAALSSEQQQSTKQRQEIKEALEAAKTSVQDVVSLCGALKQKNDELNAAGITAEMRDERLKTASETLEKRTTELAVREEQLKAKEAELKQLKDSLSFTKKDLAEREKNLRQQSLDITERETKVTAKEAELSQASEEQRLNLDRDLAAKLAENAKEIADQQAKALEDMGAQYETMRAQFHADLSTARDNAYKELSQSVEKERLREMQDVDVARAGVAQERAELAKEREELRKEKLALETKEKELEFEKTSLANKNARLDKRIKDLDADVDRRAEERNATTQIEKETLEKQVVDLKKSLASEQEKLKKYENYEIESNGRPPKAILEELNAKKQELEKVTRERDERPEQGVVAELNERLIRAQEAKREADRERNELLEKNEDVRSLELHKAQLEDENRGLSGQVERLEKEKTALTEWNDSLQKTISRLNAAEAQKADYEQRVADIMKGCDELDGVVNPQSSDEGAGQPRMDIEGERAWLEEMSRNLREYKFVISRRLLYAFHTALKTSDWSIITVLAGVSGTGKSKLPQLYSKMGRLNFISVPVQPNWDSQESMLGYFNSIDNRFDSQPVLRFLAKAANDLDKCVNIVLLDEMNLAHVEYYFAEFLSKLEMRRDLIDGKEPEVEVKLGAGVESFKVPLLRTILWVGTMNQDETTKSLSDKVLDRGIVINFPRPKTLVRSSGLGKLDEFLENKGIEARPMLHYDVWRSWIKDDIDHFSEEQKKILDECKAVLEEINGYLGQVGRALGHRVLQAVELYIVNHPDVIFEQEKAHDDATDGLRKAVKTAFEDQLVQKVMPKLRGIETRGNGKTCLDQIGVLLEEGRYTIHGDFQKARNSGYGQFIWNSAEYLDDLSDSTEKA